MANIKPVIGICTRKMDKEFFPSVGAPRSYVEAVIRAGGIPILMPFELAGEDQARLLGLIRWGDFHWWGRLGGGILWGDDERFGDGY